MLWRPPGRTELFLLAVAHGTTNGADGPLAGLVVLDLTRVFAGPYATQMMGDLGATIIKIEDPKLGDTTRHNEPLLNGQSHYFLTLNRNKKSVALDATKPEGL